MKKNLRRLISICLVFVLLFAAFPTAASAASSGKLGDNLKWSLNSSGVLTISGSGDMPNFEATNESLSEIPWVEYFDSVKSVVIRDGVSSIGSYAFYGHISLTKVTLPKSLTSIKEGAFYACASLSSITLPSKLKSIGASAFDFCPLRSVKIPASVTSIDEAAFAICGVDALNSVFTLTEFSVESSNKNYSSVNGVLFNKDRTVLLRCPMTKKGVYAVPTGVNRICEDAFLSCVYLTSINIPSTVNTIEPYAFEYCESLQSVSLPNGLKTIDEGVFNGCYNLTGITLPSSVESIGAYAFYDCGALASVIAYDTLKRVADTAFEGCTKYSDVFFVGSEESWESIADNGGNFKTATPHFDFTLPTRLAGDGRCETAAEISKASFESAENVVLASGNDYADALAGVPLAYALNAPVLLIRNHELDKATLTEMQRLGAQNVYILGGDFAISSSVESSLKNKGYSVTRLAGNDRFGTSVKIADKLFELAGAPEELFFTYSHNYPDALAISGIAAAKGCPVLYIAGNGNLTMEISQYSSSSGASSATIISGPAIVNPAAETNIEGCGISSIKRIYGADRYETCLKINKEYSDILTGESVCIATGTNYPDALAGGVFAALKGAPLMLVGQSFNSAQRDYLFELRPENSCIFGGAGAVSESVVHDFLLIEAGK